MTEREELLAELRRHQRDYPSLVHGPLCGQAADEIVRLRSGAQQTGTPSVRKLDWQDVVTDRGDGSDETSGHEADSGFGPLYVIDMYFGSDCYGWTVDYDSEKIGDCDDPEKAKEIAQTDFERRALSTVPSTQSGIPRSALAATPEEIAAAKTLIGADLYAWPIGCHSPNSCHRNGRCMYVGCKHDGKDIKALSASAIASTMCGGK